jgi:hypothetical protein
LFYFLLIMHAAFIYLLGTNAIIHVCTS